MEPLPPGTPAPPIEGLDARGTPLALFFYKTTCPVCRMAAPKAQALADAYPGHVVGVGQDPPERLRPFAVEHGLQFQTVEDPPPYRASDAYGIRTVPTLFVLDAAGAIVETIESWDRAGYDRASMALANLAGLPFRALSDADDGLPAFRPG